VSFGGNTNDIPKARPKLAGLDDLRTSTNETARPIPYIAGTQRVGVTFLSQALGYRTETSESGGKGGGGKGGGGGGTTSYYATFGAAVCLGVVGTLHEIWFDDERVWGADGALDRVDGEDFADITIEERGSARIYWGTVTQTVDPVLDAFNTIEAHPAYSGLCYIVFDQLLFGKGRNTAPSIEVVVTRRPTAPGWFTPAAAIGDGVNLPLVVWEWVTSSRFGLGRPDSAIDQASFISVGDALETEETGISVVLNAQATLRELLVRLGEHVDAYFHTGTDGKLKLGLVRALPSSTVPPILSEADLTEEPEFQPGAWADTSSGVQVRFTNGSVYYKADVIQADDPSNIAVTGETRLPVVERPWITDPAVASRAAAVLAQRMGRPRGSVTLSCLRSSAVGRQPGDVIRLFYAHLGVTNMRLRIRTVEIPSAGAQSIRLVCDADQSLLNGVYALPPAFTPPTVTTLEAEPAEAAHAAVLPPGLAGENPQVAVWVAPATLAHDRWWLHRQLPDTSFEQVGDGSGHFDARATLDTDLPIDGPTVGAVVRLTLNAPDTDLRKFPSGDISAGRVYLLNGDEWILVTSATLVAAGQYDLGIIRGRHGSEREGAVATDQVWIFQPRRRSGVEVTTPGDSTVVLKAQPGILGRRSDLSLAATLSVPVSRASLGPPSPLNLRVDSEHRSPRWAGSTDLLVEWDPAAWPTLELFDRWAVTSSDAFAVLLEVLNGSSTVVLSVEVSAGTTSHTLTFATLSGALGSPASFTIRARHRSGALISPSPATLPVTRI
jgi:hypothetical protein